MLRNIVAANQKEVTRLDQTIATSKALGLSQRPDGPTSPSRPSPPTASTPGPTSDFERPGRQIKPVVFPGTTPRLDPGAAETAYPHREPGYNLIVISEWLDRAEDEANIAWAKETFGALAPYIWLTPFM